MDIYRGDIFRYTTTTGNNNTCIVLTPYIKRGKYTNIIMLNETPKGKDPIEIHTKSGVMYACPDQVQFTLTDNLTDFVNSANDMDMALLDEAVASILGLEHGEPRIVEKIVEKKVEVPVIKEVKVPDPTVTPAYLETEKLTVMALKTEAKIYKEMYEQLLEKVTKVTT